MTDDPKQKRKTPPTGVRRALSEGAPMMSSSSSFPDVDPADAEADPWPDDETSQVHKPWSRRRATKGDLAALHNTVKTYVADDQKQHDQIRNDHKQATAAVTGRIDLHATKTEQLGAAVATLNTTTAVLSTHVERIVKHVDGTVEEERKDRLDANKFRRKLIMQVIAWVTPFVAAAATAITLAAQHC